MHWKPVVYASRSLSDIDFKLRRKPWQLHGLVRNFPSTFWATGYNPLVPLLNRTNLNSLPVRVLRFRLCLSRLDLHHHQPCPRKFSLYCRHLSVLHLPLPAAPMVRKTRRQSSLQVSLFPSCLQAKSVWMSTGQLNKTTATAGNCFSCSIQARGKSSCRW